MLTIDNQSYEHIIPDSLGGKGLRSRNLLCKTCNSGLGSIIDNSIAADLGDIVKILNIPTDHPSKGTRVKVSSTNPKLKELGCRGAIVHDAIIQQSNGKTIHLSANSYEELKKMFNKRKRELERCNISLPEFPEENQMEETGYAYINMGNTKINGKRIFEIENKLTFRALIKMCTNYALVNGVPQEELEIPLHILRTGNWPLEIVKPFYPQNHQSNSDGITHIIQLFDVEKVLIAYVELFNVWKFVIQLSKNFQGNPINQSIEIDLETREKSTPKKLKTLGWKEWYDLPYWHSSKYFHPKAIQDCADLLTMKMSKKLGPKSISQ